MKLYLIVSIAYLFSVMNSPSIVESMIVYSESTAKSDLQGQIDLKELKNLYFSGEYERLELVLRSGENDELRQDFLEYLEGFSGDYLIEYPIKSIEAKIYLLEKNYTGEDILEDLLSEEFTDILKVQRYINVISDDLIKHNSLRTNKNADFKNYINKIKERVNHHEKPKMLGGRGRGVFDLDQFPRVLGDLGSVISKGNLIYLVGINTNALFLKLSDEKLFFFAYEKKSGFMGGYSIDIVKTKIESSEYPRINILTTNLSSQNFSVTNQKLNPSNRLSNEIKYDLGIDFAQAKWSQLVEYYFNFGEIDFLKNKLSSNDLIYVGYNEDQLDKKKDPVALKSLPNACVDGKRIVCTQYPVVDVLYEGSTIILTRTNGAPKKILASKKQDFSLDSYSFMKE